MWSNYPGRYTNILRNKSAATIGSAVVDTYTNGAQLPSSAQINYKHTVETPNAGDTYSGSLYSLDLTTEVLSALGQVTAWVDTTDPVPDVTTTNAGLSFTDTSHDDLGVSGNSGINNTKLLFVPAGTSAAAVAAMAPTQWVDVSSATITDLPDGSRRDPGFFDVWVQTQDNATNQARAKIMTLENDPPRVTVALTANKTLTGGGKTNEDILGGQFDFALTLTSGDAAQVSGVPTSTVTNAGGTAAGAPVNFGDITFYAAGTYVFSASETSVGSAGYTTDTDTASFTVTVSDDSSGGFTYTVDYEKAGVAVPAIVFANTYETQRPDFSFTKISASGSPAVPLSGAKFKLYRLTCSDSAHNHSTDPVTPALIAAGCYTALKDATLADKIWISAVDGSVAFGLLDEGTYVLVEIEAPSGYHTPKGQWRLVIAPHAANPVSITAVGSLLPPAFSIEQQGANFIYRLPNYPAMTMPASGGSGVLGLLTWIGAGLILLAALLWLSGRKDRPRRTRRLQAPLSLLLALLLLASPAPGRADVLIDPARRGSVTVVKLLSDMAGSEHDGQALAQVPTGTTPLAGITFTLAALDVSGFSPRTATTDSQGRIVFANLPLGTYTLTESADDRVKAPIAPQTLAIPTTVAGIGGGPDSLLYDLTVYPKNVPIARVITEDVALYGGVNVKKLAADTKKPLPNAVFRLVPKSSASFARDLKHSGYLKKGGKVYTVKSDRKGKVAFTGIEYARSTQSPALAWRDFWLIETKAPKGYRTLATALVIRIDALSSSGYKYTVLNERDRVPIAIKAGDTTTLTGIFVLSVLALTAIALALKRRRRSVEPPQRV
jgi:pilin isopeptide linkage protein